MLIMHRFYWGTFVIWAKQKEEQHLAEDTRKIDAKIQAYASKVQLTRLF